MFRKKNAMERIFSECITSLTSFRTPRSKLAFEAEASATRFSTYQAVGLGFPKRGRALPEDVFSRVLTVCFPKVFLFLVFFPKNMEKPRKTMKQHGKTEPATNLCKFSITKTSPLPPVGSDLANFFSLHKSLLDTSSAFCGQGSDQKTANGCKR